MAKGYVRVSTTDQKTDRQFEECGLGEKFEEKASTAPRVGNGVGKRKRACGISAASP